ncbi:MAG: FAD-dependent oxidoreductase [Hyphomicrobiales bacterium]|nr:FAD-dependent oxidoreductase [Hyphomicrobiales bacterium]MBV8825129.1 FAD-dependent oxidoreductase [Hyphomicrobiales bacterium]MBV9427020.1 FAD-dependent oxidoreductase [Bradyrhizobiaceae bacterium]
MNVSDERTRSLWMDVTVAAAPRVDRNETADVAVVGSGIAGLSVAYELAQRGAAVVVLDRADIGTGMTARTTAHLASAFDDGYAELMKSHGRDVARLVYRSQAAAIDRIETIQAAEGIGCDFARLDGYLVLASGTPASALDAELAAATDAGVPVTDEREQTPIHAKSLVRSLRFANQARVHPLKYLSGLAGPIVRQGGRLYAHSPVENIEETKDGVMLTTSGGHEVRAGHAVLATNSPIVNRLAVHAKQAPYRTYAIAAPLGRGRLPDALYWDTHDPYHYVRLQPGPEEQDLVIVGGEDHKSGAADDGERRFGALERWIRDRLPKLGKLTHRWSGQVMEPIDGIGFIGRNPGQSRVFVATGDSGQGITGGALAGLILADLITGRENPWADIYDPARKPLRKLGEFVSENTTALRSFAQYLLPGEISSLGSLKPGEGGILRSGLRKVAACRDASGQLHLSSAACPHAGCVVVWNSLEQCWDCPCHGSQFAPDGSVLNGPSFGPLAPAEGVSQDAAE